MVNSVQGSTEDAHLLPHFVAIQGFDHALQGPVSCRGTGKRTFADRTDLVFQSEVAAKADNVPALVALKNWTIPAA
jgi:hypothetical protein